MSTFNRLANAANRFQGDRPRVLCVCSAGLLRSPTVAWILSNEPFGFNNRAAGSSPAFALIPVDDVLIHWADKIVFVKQENFEEVLTKFDIARKDSIILDLLDEFEFRDPELVRIATAQLIEAFKE